MMTITVRTVRFAHEVYLPGETLPVMLAGRVVLVTVPPGCLGLVLYPRIANGHILPFSSLVARATRRALQYAKEQRNGR